MMELTCHGQPLLVNLTHVDVCNLGAFGVRIRVELLVEWLQPICIERVSKGTGTSCVYGMQLELELDLRPESDSGAT